MTVYVDELRVYPHARGIFRAGSAHLTADTLDELHAFAARIGLRRSWAQLPPAHRVPHYDLVASRREAAVAAGAVFVPAKEQAARRIAARAATKSSGPEALAGSEPGRNSDMSVRAEAARRGGA